MGRLADRCPAHLDLVVMIARVLLLPIVFDESYIERLLKIDTKGGPQVDGSTKINMLHLSRTMGCVDVKQDTDAFSQALGDWYLASAHQSYFCPAQVACCQGGKFRVQVSGNSENRTGDIFWTQFIVLYEEL